MSEMVRVPEGKLLFCNHMTNMSQVCPGCRLVPQVEAGDTEKPFVVSIELISSAALPKLLSVVGATVVQVQVPLTLVHPNCKLVGDTVASGPGGRTGCNKIATPLRLVTARSSLPSPLKSPTATEVGF